MDEELPEWFRIFKKEFLKHLEREKKFEK